jgi:DNA-binding transcriptional ArsR family regulator
MEQGPGSPFAVVADPSRRLLLGVLLRAPRHVGELVAATGLSQPTVSRHLRILRDAGLVTCSAAGRRRVYAIRAQGFTELADWLTPFVLLLGEQAKPVHAHDSRASDGWPELRPLANPLAERPGR